MSSDRFKAALASLALISLPAAAQTEADILIRHVTVVDVEHGRTIPDQAVVTRADEIVAVGSDAAIAKSWKAAQTLDAGGRYIIPGLWDMHVHFGGGPDLVEENRALLPLYVAHGITTVRDASGDLPVQVLEWRGEIARGELFGPTLLSSGPKIEGLQPIWKGTIETGSEPDIDAALQKLQSLAVDFVKITDSTLRPELFLYAVRKARAAGLRTSGHIPMALTVRQAVDAGLSSIEHLDYAFDAGARDEAAIAAGFAAGRIDRAEASRRLDASFDRATAMKMYRYLARKKVFVTPTLNGSRIIAWLDRDRHDSDEYLQYIGPKLRKTYEWRVQRAAQADAAAVAFRHAHFERMAAVLPMLQEAGVTIMAGTDAGFLNSFNYPGIGLHDELALYVEKGLTPVQALSAATRAGPAWFDELDRYGAVAQGKAADLVLLGRNPLQDIGATRSIDAVILRGKLSDRAALDEMLAQARQKVAAAAAIDPAQTLTLMEKVADWQLAHLEPVVSIRVAREETRSPRSWQQGAFYAGLTALAERSKSPLFRDAVLDIWLVNGCDLV
jgi:imidazolonepropionase-like amidohydrolase